MNVRLLVVQGKPAGKTLCFGPGDYYLGRGPECHIRFNSDWVSRQHTLLRVTPAQVSVRDLGSRNGTLVNGQLIGEETFLGQGDKVQIGPVVFEVHIDQLGGEPAPAAGPPSAIFRGSDLEGPATTSTIDSTVLPPLRRDEQ